MLQRARSWAHSRDVDEIPRSTKSGSQLEAQEVSFAESPGVTLPCSQEPPTSPGPLILDVSPGGGLARRPALLRGSGPEAVGPLRALLPSCAEGG